MNDSDQTVAAEQIRDLRSALQFLRSQPGQLVTTGAPVDPYLEIAGIYKLIGAGTPAAPPTQLGPAMLFENVKGFDMQVVTGVLASRERTALLLGSTAERLPRDLLAALEAPVAPITVPEASAPCHEVVLRAPFDVRRILPALTLTSLDAGPYITLGLVRAEDPDTGESDVTIHRICLQGPDELSVFFMRGRHIDAFRRKAEAAGRPLPPIATSSLQASPMRRPRRRSPPESRPERRDEGPHQPRELSTSRPASSRRPHRSASTSSRWPADCAAGRWNSSIASPWRPRRSPTRRS